MISLAKTAFLLLAATLFDVVVMDSTDELISSVISTVDEQTTNFSCSESSENQLGYCNGSIPINSVLAEVSTQNAPVSGSPDADALVSLCKFAALLADTPTFKEENNLMNISTCGFMQERGFCQSEKPCNLSFVVFVQAKINGSFLTICAGFVFSKSEVVTSPGCYSSVNGSDLYVLFFNKQRIKVKCIKDAPLSSCNSNSTNLQTTIYVHKLVLCSDSPVPAAKVSSDNTDLMPTMVTPNVKCNNVSKSDFDFILTRVIILPGFDNIVGFFFFVPAGTSWVPCSLTTDKIVSNEGSVLVNKKCEVLGFLRLRSKALIDALYAAPLAKDTVINPKCELIGNNVKNLLPCN